ncbi:hypothetical protein FEM03_03810 [Phragmitibacter flavus]|uniref:MFS transporter n=1 Tax=Phragmitibacter flavus TaxID=2576071 RepID=A0A5R8KHV4_9BACT|nr:VC0807 family protein [Phragmitibacter flavus]TLD71862.1 hypothetical protein FEM03_03810 [Phragmitibacter flavus]
MSETATKSPPNPLLEILLTIALPSVALDQLSKPSSVGPFWALVISLLFPIGFGLWCFYKKMGWNLFSILGFLTILLSGGLGLFKLDAFWFAIKESAIPIMIAIAFPLSHRWKKPMINALLMQPQLINLRALNESLAIGTRKAQFDHALFRASCGMGLGLIGSSVANFFLAMHLLGGKEPGSEAFVRSIGTLTWMGFIVIGVPLLAVMMIVFFILLRSVEKITGLERNDLLNPGQTVRRQVVKRP